MDNYYEILGVAKDADSKTIKRAYRALALIHHPDKGGDPEMMAKLTLAHKTLMDNADRRLHDQQLEASSITSETAVPGEMPGLRSSRAEPHSLAARKLHAKLMQEFAHSPLAKTTAGNLLKPFSAGLTSDVILHDLFKQLTGMFVTIPEQPVPLRLTPSIAIDIFTQFLQGTPSKNRLQWLKQQLTEATSSVPNELTPNLAFYKEIHQLILITENGHEEKLWRKLKIILAHAKANPTTAQPGYSRLFQNKQFRKLFSKALHDYWLTYDERVDRDLLSALDGRQAAKQKLTDLQQQLHDSTYEDLNEHLIKQIRSANLLYQFEEHFDQEVNPTLAADDYAEKAFYILDWVPILSEFGSQELLINSLLRAGIYFIQPSDTQEPQQKMANERLAFEMFVNAINISRRTPANIELYALIHSLKYLVKLRYADTGMINAIRGFQQRALALANIFPFFEELQNNTSLVPEFSASLRVMRQLLHALVEIVETNQTREEKLAIDHEPVTILYQAYEACLQNWYEDTYSPVLEESMRVNLIQALLKQKNWTIENVHANTDARGIMLERNLEGWMVPSRRLPIPSNPNIVTLEAIDGLMINYHTGTLKFSARPYRPEHPAFMRLLTPFDLAELIENNIHGGIFSLDGVDPDMPYHPFNQMRFAPATLYKTQLMQNMLITDYLLKYFTVGREPRGRFPFDIRPIHTLISQLPMHLRKIIEDFRDAQRSQSVHRFWIEAGELPVAQQLSPVTDTHGLALGEIKMSFKKHEMIRDARGNLVDRDEADEGWNLYVLNYRQKQEIIVGIRSIDAPAIILTAGTAQVYFYEEDELSPVFAVQDFSHSLMNLFAREQDAQQKVLRNARNAWLSYLVTREVTRQAGKDHHFSPEYCFAQEFIAHYNEFAQYFPAFGRLRELTRAVALVNYLCSLRDNNQEEIERLQKSLEDQATWKPFAEIIQQNNSQYEALCSEIRQEMQETLQKLFAEVHTNINNIKSRHAENLNKIHHEVQPLTFHIFSPMVIEHCNAIISTMRPPETFIEKILFIVAVLAKRADIAQQMTQIKRASAFNQLQEIFSPLELERFLDRSLAEMINRFLDGNATLLYYSFVQREIVNITEQLHQQMPQISLSEIHTLVINQAPVDSAIVDRLTAEHFASARQQVDAAIRNIESEKARLRSEIETKISRRNRLKAQIQAMGLPDKAQKVDLANKCFWVPASTYHEVTTRHSRFVYGGVKIYATTRDVNTTEPMHRSIINNTFNNPRQAGIDANYIAAARAHASRVGGGHGSANVLYHLRAAELAQRQAMQANASAAGGTTGGGGFRPPVAPPPPPPPAPPGGGGNGSDGNGRGGRPPVPPSGPTDSYDGAAERPRRPAAGAGAGAGAGSGTGLGSRPPSPTAFYEASHSAGAGAGFDRTAATRGFQDHHIISHTNQLTKDHALLKLAGFDLESRSNKIFLPTGDSLHNTRSIHRGRHTEEYHAYVSRRMDEIVEQGRMEGWAQAEYRAALDMLLADARRELKAGTVPLNKHARPWADPSCTIM